MKWDAAALLVTVTVLTPVLAGAAQGDSFAERALLERVEPAYPEEAKSRGISGYVELLITVTAAGRVADVHVWRAEPEGVFEASAVAAVRQWRYVPRTGTGSLRERIFVVLKFELAADQGPPVIPRAGA